jgi:phosphohistidine phosphatase
MELILWRHAEAEVAVEGQDDLSRRLTAKGEKQAARMADWLERQLPEGARVLCSPAVRTEQTARALKRCYKLRAELAPDGSASDLLNLVQWPTGKQLVVVVGHQPALGEAIAQVLGLASGSCAVRKGALWWLRARERDGQWHTLVRTVQSPELL